MEKQLLTSPEVSTLTANDEVVDEKLSHADENEPVLKELPPPPLSKLEDSKQLEGEALERVTGFLEFITKQILEREEARDKERYSKGFGGERVIFGTPIWKAKKWLNATDEGRAAKIVGKALIGTGLAVGAGVITGGAGLLLAPLAFGLGTKAIGSSVAEAAQYLFGKGKGDTEDKENRLSSGRSERIAIEVRRKELMAVAHIMFDKLQQRAGGMPESELTLELESIISQIAEEEKNIVSLENRNIKREATRKAISDAVGTATTLGVGLINGVPLGTQGFKNGPTGHAVRLMKNGFDFVYNSKDAIAPTVHGMLTGGLYHGLGGIAGFDGWLNAGRAALGLAGGAAVLGKNSVDAWKAAKNPELISDQGAFKDPRYKILKESFTAAVDETVIEKPDTEPDEITSLVKRESPPQLEGTQPPLLEDSIQGNPEGEEDIIEGEFRVETTVLDKPETPSQLTGPGEAISDKPLQEGEKPKHLPDKHAADRYTSFERKYSKLFKQGKKDTEINTFRNIKENIETLPSKEGEIPNQKYIFYVSENDIDTVERKIATIDAQYDKDSKSDPQIQKPVYKVFIAVNEEAYVKGVTSSENSASALHSDIRVNNFRNQANESLHNTTKEGGKLRAFFVNGSVDLDPYFRDLQEGGIGREAIYEKILPTQSKDILSTGDQKELVPFNTTEELMAELVTQLESNQTEKTEEKVEMAEALWKILEKVDDLRGEETVRGALESASRGESITRSRDMINVDATILHNRDILDLISKLPSEMGFRSAVRKTLQKQLGPDARLIPIRSRKGQVDFNVIHALVGKPIPQNV